MKTKFETEIKRINGYLKEVTTFFDNSGNPISHVINPLMVELRPRDIAQLLIGSLLVGTPLCLSEEVWELSKSLPIVNIHILLFTAISTLSFFVYFNFYRFKLKGNILNLFKRVIATYFIPTISIVFILLIIDKLPIKLEPILSYKRVILISFPSIFGAAITDYLK